MRPLPAVLLPLLLTSACAQGETDPGGPPRLMPGEYELTTLEVDDACRLADAVTPGDEFIGKVERVLVTPSNDAVRFEVCDPFFSGSCMPSFDERYTWSALDDGGDLTASSTQVELECFCFDEVLAARSLSGEVISEGEAELEWSIQLPGADPSCDCPAAQACTATLRQVLSVR
jgi:hypothetical protein